MGTITLLLGKNRRRRKQSMASLGHAALDARNRPLFLVLTATQRKAEVVRREFHKQEGKPPAFAPEVRVFSEFLEFLATRHASGKAILPENARTHAALAQLQRHTESTSFAEAESLARAHALWAESMHSSNPSMLAPEVQALFQRLNKDIEGLSLHTPLQSALAQLRTALEHPSASLQKELRRFSSVVIDDILQLTPLRQALLVSLCRAWQKLGTHVVVCFESSRSLGGPEVGAFFNFDPLHASAYPLRAFDASKALRCSLFERLIGQGDGRICIAAAEGPRFIEPGEDPGPQEKPDLSDCVYSHQSLPVATQTEALAWLEGRVEVFECRDPYNEHRNTAMKLCNLIQGGVNPADCCVAVANLERELPVLSQVFADHGLSFDVATGPPLASLPVPALLLAIPQAFQQPDSAVELLKVLQTDLVRAPGGLDLAAIWAVCRCTGIHEGSPKDWLNEWDSKQIPLPQGLENAVLGFQHLFDTLTNRFNEQHSPGSFEEAILETAERLGLPNTCHAEGGSNRADQHAHLGWIRATERLGTWRNELLATDRSSWGFDELLTSLTRCFQASRVATEPRRDEAVKVVGILELRGLTPRHLFLSNLIRASFPTPRALNPFLSHETGRRLEAIDPMSEARYLLMSALRNSLGDGDIQTLTLSWPAVSRGRETVPASALQDLLSTQTQCPKGSTLGRFILQRPGHATPTPICQTDILTRLAAAGNFSDAPWLNLPLINRQRECMHNRGKDTFSNYDGHLVSAPPLPSSIGPTGVESYVRCSARHWYSRVLRLSGLPTYEPQVPPGVRGTAMHLILERYEKQGPDPANPAAELHAIALEVFSELEVGYVGNTILLHIERDRMAAGLVDDAPGGPLKAWLELETTHQDWRTPEASELSFEDIQVGPVRLRGSIDRVDRLNSPKGHLVIDFKTGSVPSADLVRKGLAFQPIAYLEATARIWPDEPGVAAYMSVGKAGAVSFNTWVGDPSLIGSLVPKRRQRSAVPLDSQQRKALLDYAADSMKRMHRGVFHTTLSSPDEAGCTSCDFRRICRVDRHRNQRIAESGGDLQLPFEMEEA